MRLIDADALMKTLGITDMDCEKCAWGNKSFPTCNRGSDFADACSAIEDAPTAQPERKSGKWIPHEDDDGEHYGDRCSVCGEWYVMLDGRTNYCPNCGADMRGEEG